MSVPINPSEMQSYILERLAKEPPPTKTDYRLETKFAEELGDIIEARIKDAVFHKLEIRLANVTIQSFEQFANSADNTTPVTVFKNEYKVPFALLRCENNAASILANLYLGGDLDAPIAPVEITYTPGEIILLDLLALEVSRALNTKTSESTTVSTVSIENLDRDDISEGQAAIFDFEIIAGVSKCSFTLALPQHLTTGAKSEVPHSSGPASMQRAEGLKKIKVMATIELTTPPSILQTVRDLAVGDCLPLDISNRLQGRLMINGKHLCTGEIGRSGEAYSFKMSDMTDTDSNSVKT